MRLRAGKTAAGDLEISVSRYGGFVIIGRLDGGINFRPSDWRKPSYSARRLLAGPFDFRYVARQEEEHHDDLS